MRIPGLSKEQGRLLQKTGNGLQLSSEQGSLQLTFHQQSANNGLILHARLADNPLQLWLSQEQWCQWVEPMLAVPSLELTPPDLRDLLAYWTLADASECRGGNELAWPEAQCLQVAEATAGLGWQLSIQRGERRLDLRLLAGCEEWIDSLTKYMYPAVSGSESVITFNASLLAGYSQIGAAQLKQLRPGDALLLQKSWQVSAGQFALFLERPVAILESSNAGDNFYVEAIMSEFDDWMDITPGAAEAAGHTGVTGALDTALVTVRVEVAQLTVSLQELSTLAAGTLLNGGVSYDGLVTLKVGNSAIARGTLLEIDSQLAIKIDHLF